jgi:hypothetical protein
VLCEDVAHEVPCPAELLCTQLALAILLLVVLYEGTHNNTKQIR